MATFELGPDYQTVDVYKKPDFASKVAGTLTSEHTYLVFSDTRTTTVNGVFTYWGKLQNTPFRNAWCPIYSRCMMRYLVTSEEYRYD